MFQISKLIASLIAELVFDSKEEYNLKSDKFNTRKVIVMIFITLSITANIFILYRFIHLADLYLELNQACKAQGPLELMQEPRKPPNLPSAVPSNTQQSG